MDTLDAVHLLSFSAPVDELAEVFTALFDAVAAGLMWIQMAAA